MTLQKRTADETDSTTGAEETLVGRLMPQQDTITLIGPPQMGRADPMSSRWATFIASPRTVIILLPLLVLVLGVTLTVIGQLALSVTSKTMAKERFVEQTASSTIRVESALAQADPLLLELKSIALQTRNGQPELAHVAAQMRDLLLARSAISQAYIAFKDGNFWGVGPGAEGDLEFQQTVKQTSVGSTIAAGKLVTNSSHFSSFDPRTRAWYLKAEEEKTPIWSKPYVFYFNHHPGITRALPIYDDEEHHDLIGVVGVDFDVEALTAFMAAGESGNEGARTVVFSGDGVVLAYPYGAKKLAVLPRNDQVITHEVLGDSDLSALVESIASLPNKKRNIELHRFVSKQSQMLASVRTIGHFDPEWYVASFAHESSILRELHTHRARSLWIGGLSLALAVAMAWWLAQYILGVKDQALRAQVAAVRAQEEVRDLGSYRLISILGEGGMGEVWRARHHLLAREAAIKLIKLTTQEESRREEQRERFRREAQAIAGLRSRNTVALFDYGVTPDGTLFYAMELLDGIDLSRLVARHGPQSPDRVRQILVQVCSSLSEAHEAQLIHRDIKPANLFLCREAEEVDIVKVLDFGLVFHVPTLKIDGTIQNEIDTFAPTLRNPMSQTALDRPTDIEHVEAVTTERLRANDAQAALDQARLYIGWDQSNQPEWGDDLAIRITNPEHQLGTPAFMSPEQAAGAVVDHRTDIYSLGCVAWWLLTGHPPFKADSQLEYMTKHMRGTLPDLAQQAPVLSPEFRELIISCLSKDPFARPESARTLVQRLRSVEPGGAPWSQQECEQWWSTHRPRDNNLVHSHGGSPLRDAQIVGPEAPS